jgi:hypothetical protein
MPQVLHLYSMVLVGTLLVVYSIPIRRINIYIYIYIYIENVWGYLTRKAYRGEMPFSAINVLKEAILREWSALPVSYLQKVVDILNE